MVVRFLVLLSLLLCLFPAVGCRQAPPQSLTYELETPLGPVAIKLNKKQVPKAVYK